MCNTSCICTVNMASILTGSCICTVNPASILTGSCICTVNPASILTGTMCLWTMCVLMPNEARCNRLRCPLARMSGLQCFNMGHNGHGINLYGVSMTLMEN